MPSCAKLSMSGEAGDRPRQAVPDARRPTSRCRSEKAARFPVSRGIDVVVGQPPALFPKATASNLALRIGQAALPCASHIEMTVVRAGVAVAPGWRRAGLPPL